MLVLHSVEICVPGAHDWRLILELPARSRISEDQAKVRAVGALRDVGLALPANTHLVYRGLIAIPATT